MKIDTTRDKFIVVFFVALICVPGVGYFFAPRSSLVLEQENRARSAIPELPNSFRDFHTYARRFEAYFDDHFGFRDVMTFAYAQLLYRAFGVTPFSRVHLQAGGWAFENIPGGGKDCESFLRGSAWHRKQAELFREHRESLRALGIDYVLVLVPPKPTIYVPSAPQRHCEEPETNAGRIVDILRQEDVDFPVLNLFSTLVEARISQRVYFLADPHWNDLGAFHGYQAIADDLKERGYEVEVPQLEQWDQEVRGHLAGAHSRFANVDLGRNEDVFLTPKRAPKAVRLGPAATERDSVWSYDNSDARFRNLEAPEVKTLVFRDSFFKQLVAWLPECFRETVFVWSSFDLSRVRAEKPDLVIEQVNL